jgi:ATP-dependent DNA ligase
VNHLKVRSCLIDGEIVCYDERGLATFQLLRHRRNEPQAFLYAFDLLELNARTCGASPSSSPKQKGAPRANVKPSQYAKAM